VRPEQGRLLVRLARGAIHAELHRPLPPDEQPDWLSEPGATFVTLHRLAQLRGCIGSIEPRRPVGEDVRENAVAAAMRDPRFMPMTTDELVDLEVEVALLSALEPISVKSEGEALARIRPGTDGLVLTYGTNKGTFLPQMWEQLPAPKEFLRCLKQKAGLPRDFWEPTVQLQRFTAEKWGDAGPPAQA
jgi:AmmeMemoRadiSam system protein A